MLNTSVLVLNRSYLPVHVTSVLPTAPRPGAMNLESWGWVLVWTVFWPTCVLFWMSRRGTCEEVAAWK